MNRNDLTQLAEARKLIEQARAIIVKIEGDDLDTVETALSEAIDDIDTIQKIEAPKAPARRKTGDAKLKELVREALRNGKENGYNMGAPSRQLAEDMVRCDAALENESVERVAQMIVQIRIDDGDPFAAERERFDPDSPEMRGWDPFD